MKLIYSNENKFIVHNIKNILEAEGIEVFLKNEFAQGAMGEISVFDTWPEIWVTDEKDYQKAKLLIDSIEQNNQDDEWFCSGCAEKNDVSFEICWNCQQPRET